MPATRKPPPPPPSTADLFDAGMADGDIPEVEKRSRTSKLKKLEGSVAGLYIMSGGAMSTLPEQVGGARVKLIGLNVAKSADEIAEAWIDLAEDDKRVLKALESLTSFSGWGKVIGVHLMAVGSAVPGLMGAMPQPVEQAQGMAQAANQQSNADLQQAMIVAEMLRQASSQQRAERAGPQFAEQVPPQAPQQQQQPLEDAPRVRRQQPVTRPGRNAGIPSAADLGVSIADAPVDFPAGGSESVQG